MSKTHPLSAPVWLFLLVCVLTAAIYLPGLAGDYVFDDMPNLLNNKRLQIDSLDMESLQGAALSSGSGMLRRPVSMMSFALNRYFFGVAPYSYKAVNLVIHLLTGLGLYLFSRLLVNAYRLCHKPDLPEAAATWLPVIVSGLWLVHPAESDLGALHRTAHDQPGIAVHGVRAVPVCSRQTQDAAEPSRFAPDPDRSAGLWRAGDFQQGKRGLAATVYADRGNDAFPFQG